MTGEPLAPENALALMTERMTEDLDMGLLTRFKGMLLDTVPTA